MVDGDFEFEEGFKMLVFVFFGGMKKSFVIVDLVFDFDLGILVVFIF